MPAGAVFHGMDRTESFITITNEELPITAVLSHRPGRQIATLPSVRKPVGFGLTTTSVGHEHMAKSEGARELCTLCAEIIITIHCAKAEHLGLQ